MVITFEKMFEMVSIPIGEEKPLPPLMVYHYVTIRTFKNRR